MTRFYWIFPGALLAAAVGCSPANYGPSITTLDSSLNTTVSTIDTIDTRITTARQQSVQAAILDGSGRLRAGADECAQGDKSCVLSVQIRGQSGEVSYPVRSVMPRAGLAALQSYTDKLKAIVEADTTEQITNNVNGTVKDLLTIQGQIKAAGGKTSSIASTVSTYAEPVGALINWVAGVYVDTVKVDALADATRAADPVVQELVAYHREAAQAALAFDIGSAEQAFLTAKAAYDNEQLSGSIQQTTVDAYVAAAETLNGALVAKAADPLQAFGAAHATLTKQLNGQGDITLADAIGAIEDVARRAQAFAEVAESLKAAGKEAE